MVSSTVCKFDSVPSSELSEDSTLDGGLVVEAVHRIQTHPQRPNEPLQWAVGTHPFPPQCT